MKSRKPLGCLAALALLLPLLQGGPAQAQELRQGQQAALTIDAVVGAGSLVSIIGIGTSLRRGGEVRSGWLVSGYILGTMNLAIGPLLFVYGRDPFPGLGFGLGAVHSALGVANVALAIYGAVVNRRLHQQHIGERVLSRMTLVPITGRDSSGRLFAGAGISFARF